jgi:hypothetical protein
VERPLADQAARCKRKHQRQWNSIPAHS